MQYDPNELMVTIKCLTYNHEPFIQQCLEGFVMQNTNFRFEAVVHDDASTDKTADIIREYAAKYPEIIKPIYETENQYSKHDGSIRRIMNAHTRGKYIALCEGDDYWTDPLKLQKQVDFLEEHEDFVICFTNTMIKNELTGENSIAKINVWDEAETADLLKHNSLEGPRYGEVINSPGHTSTVVYRRCIISEFPNWYYKCFIGDEPLFLILSKYGKAKFINEVCTVYRKNNTGISTYEFSFEKDYRGRLFIYKKLKTYFDKKLHHQLNNIIARYHIKLFKLYKSQKKYFKAFVSICNALINDWRLFIIRKTK